MNSKTPTAQGPGLTPEQLSFYRTFGFVALRGLFSKSELTTINKEVEEAMRDQYPHKPYDGSERHWTMMMDESTPFLPDALPAGRLAAAMSFTMAWTSTFMRCPPLELPARILLCSKTVRPSISLDGPI